MMKNIALTIICLLMLTGISYAAAGKVTLSWDAPTTYVDGSPLLNADIGGYELKCGTVPGTYTITRDAGKVLTYEFYGLTSGTNYYCTGRVYLTGKTTFSDNSNEVNKAAVPVPPMTIILRVQ